MNILINGLQIDKNNSGVQYYTKHLYDAIQKINPADLEIQLYKRNTNFRSLFSLLRFPSFRPPFSRFLSPSKGRLSRILNENFCLPKYLKKHNFFLFHSPNYILPFFMNIPSIVTVHDLFTFDFSKLCRWKSVIYFKLFLPLSIKKADKIITVSETVKKDILSRFNIPDKKVVVVPLSVSPIFKRTINSNH
jgi:glycosyltransferase involved in cell wall biosynthesis